MTKAEAKLLRVLGAEYVKKFPDLQLFSNQLVMALQSSPLLKPHIHSIRYRMKDPKHLRGKLERKLGDAKRRGRRFAIAPDNLLYKINDLIGIRILHLNTRQIREIDNALQGVLAEGKWALLEGPTAKTWDDESRDFFKSCKIQTEKSPSLYTSVHYVVGSASRTKMTAEIQVRTLMEEVWGEVDHSINYPKSSGSLSCREQIKALARVTSSATRLVDAIFSSHLDYQKQRTRGGKRKLKRQALGV